MHRIKQAAVSPGLKFFKDKFLKKYNLVEYSDPDEPAIFFGIYFDEDYKLLFDHKSHKSIIFGGSDILALYFPGKAAQIFHPDFLKNSRIIAISSFISKLIYKLVQIKTTSLPITPTEIKKNIEPRGDNIYFYYSGSENDRIIKYRGDIVDGLKKIGINNIIEAHCSRYNSDELNEIYKSCFLGLRLTDHDGLSNTVIELGLMGRRCIHNNFYLPHIRDYSSLRDIILHIQDEYRYRHQDNSKIADHIYNYLNITDDWLMIK